MPAETLATTAVVLDRRLSGDNWLRLNCLSLEHGHLDCLQRQARRTAATNPPLDLFDEARLSLETRNAGRTWFVREAVVLTRRVELGRSYDSLRFACRFAQVLAQNPASEETRPQIHDLFLRALAAWETHQRPDAVYFKSLYLLAREEGYPLKEDWLRRLDAADTRRVEAILRETTAAQTTPEPDVAHLTEAMEKYIRFETDLRLAAD